MNDEIQVTNRELLIACYARIIELLDYNNVRYEATAGTRGPCKVVVYASLNDDFLEYGSEYKSWTFSQTRDDPHMQSALVEAERFIRDDMPRARRTKAEFDAKYEDLKETLGDNFREFLTLALSRLGDEEYESSSWSSSSENCW